MARILTLAIASLTLGILTGGPAMAADAAAGGKIFKAQCGLCHGTTASASAGIGPSLAGVVGRTSGTQAGFASRYSPALKAAKRVWTPENLEAWIGGPAKAVPGSRMPFAGLHDAGQVEDVVAYLKTLK